MAEAPLYLTFRAPQRVADIRNKPNTPSATSTVGSVPNSNATLSANPSCRRAAESLRAEAAAGRFDLFPRRFH